MWYSWGLGGCTGYNQNSILELIVNVCRDCYFYGQCAEFHKLHIMVCFVCTFLCNEIKKDVLKQMEISFLYLIYSTTLVRVQLT